MVTFPFEKQKKIVINAMQKTVQNLITHTFWLVSCAVSMTTYYFID